MIKRRQKGWDVLNEFDMLFEDALAQFLKDERSMSLFAPQLPANADRAMDTLTITPAAENRVEVPFGEMIRMAEASCVTVITEAGHGSGAVIDSEGYVLSAHHVVDGTSDIEVLFSNGLRQKASIVFSDAAYDLVLLDISGSGYRPIGLHVDDDAELGDDVLTIGTPVDRSLGQSVAKGVISGKRVLEGQEFIQTDLAVSPGNSGGPLLNKNGAVIGVIQSKMIGKGIEGVGSAMPMHLVVERLGLRIAGAP